MVLNTVNSIRPQLDRFERTYKHSHRFPALSHQEQAVEEVIIKTLEEIGYI